MDILLVSKKELALTLHKINPAITELLLCRYLFAETIATAI